MDKSKGSDPAGVRRKGHFGLRDDGKDLTLGDIFIRGIDGEIDADIRQQQPLTGGDAGAGGGNRVCKRVFPPFNLLRARVEFLPAAHPRHLMGPLEFAIYRSQP